MLVGLETDSIEGNDGTDEEDFVTHTVKSSDQISIFLETVKSSEL